MIKGEVYAVVYDAGNELDFIIELDKITEGPHGASLAGKVLKTGHYYQSGEEILLTLSNVISIVPTKRPTPEFQNGDVYRNRNGALFLRNNGKWYTDTKHTDATVTTKVMQGEYEKVEW